MVAKIASIQVGSIRTEGTSSASNSMDRRWTTAFYKFPIPGPVKLYALGVEGDQVADKRFHGGPDKAVLGYGLENYAKWSAELNVADFETDGQLRFDAESFGGEQFGPGAFAENLTIAGQDESSVCLGDRYQIGDDDELSAVVEVSQPRQPCWKISRRWKMKTLTKLVAATGRTGWYFRVIREGQVNIGDEVRLLDRPHPNWTVARANDILLGRELDRYAVAELMAMEVLSKEWKESLS
jgi:MOSC domain-containing protein YiiM